MANVKLLNAQGQPVVYSNVNQVTLYNEADQPVVFSIDSAPPTETLNVSDNGTVNVLNYAWANVNVTADKVDAGQVSITSNGIHNVVGAAQAVVNVPSQGIMPSGSVTIDHNGTFNVMEQEFAIVNVAASTLVSDTLNIYRNGNFDVTDKASVAVNVPASETDTLGTKTIVTNATHNVVGYSLAAVNVPASETDTLGAKSISANGTHNVVGYSRAIVNVPASAVDSGTTNPITTNGTHDVTGYKYALVNVPGVQATFQHSIAVHFDTTDGTYYLSLEVKYRVHDTNNPANVTWGTIIPDETEEDGYIGYDCIVPLAAGSELDGFFVYETSGHNLSSWSSQHLNYKFISQEQNTSIWYFFVDNNTNSYNIEFDAS